MSYKTCPYCEANIDCGEQCDCRKKETEVKDYEVKDSKSGEVLHDSSDTGNDSVLIRLRLLREQLQCS